jgi:hypothetical protein
MLYGAILSLPLIKGAVFFANDKFGQKERALVRAPSFIFSNNVCETIFLNTI